jgi:hypothetical protein
VSDPDGQPNSDVVVTASRGAEKATGRLTSPGTFSFEKVEEGAYQLVAGIDADAGAAGANAASVSATIGQTVRASLTVERPNGRISGRVVDQDGVPWTDAWVSAQPEGVDDRGLGQDVGRPSRSVLTDSAGTFSLEGLAERVYAVHASRDVGGEGVVSGVSTGSSIVIELMRPAIIVGSVVTADSRPVSNALVEATSATGGAVSARTQDGAFRLTGVMPGEVEVRATSAEGTTKAQVRVAPGESRERLDLRLVPNRSMRGELVTAENGEPIANARLLALVPEAATALEAVRSDAMGRFELSGIPPGDVQLLCTGVWQGTGFEHTETLRDADVTSGQALRIEIHPLPVAAIRPESDR